MALIEFLESHHALPESFEMTDFSILVNNKLFFFDCVNPAPAIFQGNEILKVERKGEQLTIMEASDVFRAGSRIHAVLKSSKGSESIFTIQSKLAPGKGDSMFFAAEGTAKVTQPEAGKIALYVKGTDSAGGSCRGWIFEATEA